MLAFWIEGTLSMERMLDWELRRSEDQEYRLVHVDNCLLLMVRSSSKHEEYLHLAVEDLRYDRQYEYYRCVLAMYNRCIHWDQHERCLLRRHVERYRLSMVRIR